jgi:hypothetical protein
MKITKTANTGLPITPAWTVTVSDIGGDFGGLDDLQEILEAFAAGSLGQFLTKILGGQGKVQPLGNITGTAIVDLADGNAFTATLTGNVTVTTVGWPSTAPNTDAQVRLSIAGGAGGFLPIIDGVTWTTPAPGIVAAGDTLHVVLWGDTGGTVIWGAVVGSASTTLLVVQEVDGTPAVAATEIDFPDGSLTVAGTVATPHLLTARGGERSEVQTIAASGTSQTLDLSLYNTFDITLTGNCTLTFSNPPPSGVDAHWTFVLRQGGAGSFTVTWPGTVAWQDPTDGTTGGAAPTLWTAVGAQDTIEVSTTDGGTTYGGSYESAGAALALDDLTDVTLTSPALADRLRFDGSVWRNSALVWTPLTVYDPTTTNYLPLVDGSGNQIMAEV